VIELAASGRERCVLVGVSTRTATREVLADSLDELELLADTAGADVVARMTQDRDRFEPATYIGKGKVDELKTLVQEQRIPLVIFDDDLTPAQVRNLETALECKVLDRSGLILDIFASRARSSEAKTQVELAQLQYLLPRLTRAWTHLSKQFGGIGTKGPGETQIETDRRMIRTRISHLKEKLERIGQQRETQRKGRRKHLRAALVGYTNVGKSTLLNILSGSDVFVENRLFATLDPTTRYVDLGSGNAILMTDTVGFIRKLPHHLVASFKSTLEEVTEADLLLHVVDVSHRSYEEQIAVVRETLAELNAADRTTLMVFNKVDRLADRGSLSEVAHQHPSHVFISATRGINLLGLKEALVALLKQEFREVVVRLKHTQQRAISQLFNLTEVTEQRYVGDEALLIVRMAARDERQVRQIVREAGGTITSGPAPE
jgi:GTP-binding protein HflX